MQVLSLHCLHTNVYFSGQEPLKGYDFMVNSVWPEVVELLETRATSVFAPGNPDKFYKVFPSKLNYNS